MRITQMLLLGGLCGFLAACATSADQLAGNNPSYKQIGLSDSELGKRYLLGHGVKVDDAKALMYFERAANAGDPFAENEVAYLYAAGKGTPQDYSKALFWYHKAAEQNLASAQYNLGMLYEYGLGTPKNPTVARMWYQKAATNHFEPAKVALKRMPNA